ncbi:hypothetical protein CHS0354_006187 [Potamilus streckersoni]|uniref:Uncharacterized protein n=1 Tax=Potamilus streckersoni TaxID=2493646 RepID=A0AAE0TF45_9BIVA|nr:hypothetical protein CHS0354_006187 [Potamilus streckersoni]
MERRLCGTTTPTKKTATGEDQGVITWNSEPNKTSKKDEPRKTMTKNSGLPFDNQLFRESIQRIEDGSSNTVADRIYYQGLPTVNKSQMTDSVGPLGKFVTPPESSEFLGSAVKDIVGVAGGGGLGTMLKVATTLGRLQRIMGKHKSPKASKYTGYSVMKKDGFPMESLGGIGGQNSLLEHSNPHALQEVQLFQQHVASQNAFLPQPNPFLAQSLGLQGFQNPQIGLQTPQLGLQNPHLAFQNQLDLQNSFLGAQNPNGLQNSYFGMQNFQFDMQPTQQGLGMQGQTNPLLGQSQFGMGGLQLGNLPQHNQFGQFMPDQGMGGTGQQLTSQWSGTGGGSPSNMFGGGLGSSISAGVSGLRGVEGHSGAGINGGAGGPGGMLGGLMSGERGAGGLGSLLGTISPDHLNSVTSLLSGPQGDVLQKSVFDLLNGENGGAIKSAINSMLAGDMTAMGNLQSMLSGSAGDSIRKVVKNSLKP